jgi:hypothetical protein
MRYHAAGKNLAPSAPPHAASTRMSPSNEAALCILLTSLEATLIAMLASVDSKLFTETLNSLDATLTKNHGGVQVLLLTRPVARALVCLCRQAQAGPRPFDCAQARLSAVTTHQEGSSALISDKESRASNSHLSLTVLYEDRRQEGPVPRSFPRLPDKDCIWPSTREIQFSSINLN